MPIPYDESLREQIRDRVAGHDRRVVADPSKRHAAVAVLLVDSEVGEDRIDPAPVDDWLAGRPMPEAGLDGRMVDVSGGAAFLLCRRASRLSSHPAQWALPGGRVDQGESAVDAALRELAEEVGIKLDAPTVLGLLDDYPGKPAAGGANTAGKRSHSRSDRCCAAAAALAMPGGTPRPGRRARTTGLRLEIAATIA